MKDGEIHIYRENWQPMTRFRCYDHTFRNSPHKRFDCHECGDTRTAKNLEVQAYYDYWRIRCKGGKHPGWQ